MHKKTIALFCIFLVLLLAFAACKKRSAYGTLIVDEQGMEHVIMTDANGVTVVDDEGRLVEVMTDSGNKKPITVPTENGTASDGGKHAEYETHPVTFPGAVENGNVVENVDCKVTLPDGWEQIGNGMLILRHTETDARIIIQSDIGGTVTDAVEKLNSEIEVLSPEKGYEQTDIVIDGILVTRTQYELGNMTLTSYLLLTERGTVSRISCTVETDKAAAANIDALVQSFQFK